jgi:hypothetical protein
MLRAYSRPRGTASLPARAPTQTPPQMQEQQQNEDGENAEVSLKNLFKLPTICARVSPSKSITKKFVFPAVSGGSSSAGGAPHVAQLGTTLSVVVVPPSDDDDTQSEEEDEDEHGTDVDEEDHGQSEDGTPVNDEEATNGTEVPSTLPHAAVNEPPDGDEEALEDDGNQEESIFTAAGGSEIPEGVQNEDQEPGNDDNTNEPNGLHGDDDVDEVRVDDELHAGSSSSSQAGNNAGPATQNGEDVLSAQTPSPTTSGLQQATESVGGPTTSETFTNPYPFPPWYPESAHFVRQWWPTLPGVQRLSCTVVLLAAHDPETHSTRFALAQHYFKVPIAPDTLPIVGGSTSGSSRPAQPDDDDMLHLWYVSMPFEVVCVLDEGDDDEDAGGRPRPLVAVDFGHAVWVEYAAAASPPNLDVRTRAGGESLDNTDDVQHNTEPDTHPHAHFVDDDPHPPLRRRTPKCLRFVTFPPVYGRRGRTGEAVVRTLEIPEELDLNVVETINIDQSQGAVILSVRDGRIFILRYE